MISITQIIGCYSCAANFRRDLC